MEFLNDLPFDIKNLIQYKAFRMNYDEVIKEISTHQNGYINKWGLKTLGKRTHITKISKTFSFKHFTIPHLSLVENKLICRYINHSECCNNFSNKDNLIEHIDSPDIVTNFENDKEEISYIYDFFMCMDSDDLEEWFPDGPYLLILIIDLKTNTSRI